MPLSFPARFRLHHRPSYRGFYAILISEAESRFKSAPQPPDQTDCFRKTAPEQPDHTGCFRNTFPQPLNHTGYFRNTFPQPPDHTGWFRTKKRDSYLSLRSSSYGNRTHDSAVRGQRLNPLTNEPYFFVSGFCLTQVIYYQRIPDNASTFLK